MHVQHFWYRCVTGLCLHNLSACNICRSGNEVASMCHQVALGLGCRSRSCSRALQACLLASALFP